MQRTTILRDGFFRNLQACFKNSINSLDKNLLHKGFGPNVYASSYTATPKNEPSYTTALNQDQKYMIRADWIRVLLSMGTWKYECPHSYFQVHYVQLRDFSPKHTRWEQKKISTEKIVDFQCTYNLSKLMSPGSSEPAPLSNPPELRSITRSLLSIQPLKFRYCEKDKKLEKKFPLFYKNYLCIHHVISTGRWMLKLMCNIKWCLFLLFFNCDRVLNVKAPSS